MNEPGAKRLATIIFHHTSILRHRSLCYYGSMIPFLIAFYRFGQGLRTALRDPEFEAIFTLLVILLGVGTFFYHDVEGWSWLNSLYFCVITLATIGYGDFTPHTDMGKIFTMVYIFLGIGVLLGFINTMATHAVQQSKNKPFLPIPKITGWGTQKSGNEVLTADTDKTAQVG